MMASILLEVKSEIGSFEEAGESVGAAAGCCAVEANLLKSSFESKCEYCLRKMALAPNGIVGRRRRRCSPVDNVIIEVSLKKALGDHLLILGNWERVPRCLDFLKLVSDKNIHIFIEVNRG